MIIKHMYKDIYIYLKNFSLWTERFCSWRYYWINFRSILSHVEMFYFWKIYKNEIMFFEIDNNHKWYFVRYIRLYMRKYMISQYHILSPFHFSIVFFSSQFLFPQKKPVLLESLLSRWIVVSSRRSIVCFFHSSFFHI